MSHVSSHLLSSAPPGWSRGHWQWCLLRVSRNVRRQWRLNCINRVSLIRINSNIQSSCSHWALSTLWPRSGMVTWAIIASWDTLPALLLVWFLQYSGNKIVEIGVVNDPGYVDCYEWLRQRWRHILVCGTGPHYHVNTMVSITHTGLTIDHLLVIVTRTDIATIISPIVHDVKLSEQMTMPVESLSSPTDRLGNTNLLFTFVPLYQSTVEK